MKSILILTTALALLSSSVLAGPKHGGRHHGISHLAKHLIYQLDLSQDQKNQIKTIAEEFKAQNKQKSHLDRRENREKMRAIMTAPSFDEAAARAVLKEKFDARIEKRIAFMRAKHQILAILTESQRAEVESMMTRRKDKHR